jgi:proline dehydrogenase
MLEGVTTAAFSLLSGSSLLKRLAFRYGMRAPEGFARRFVAGETVAEAIAAARALEASGFHVTLDYLGDHATSTAAANDVTREYVAIIGEVERSGIGRNVSVKLTQLGMDVDRATSIDNLRRVLDTAGRAECFVRVDMERPSYIDQTFNTFETLWNIGYRGCGIAVQAALRRSAKDTDRLNAIGASVRLVKGAYSGPREAAFQHKAEIDQAFVRLMQALLERGTDPAIATHDPALIEATVRFAESRGLGKDTYQFEMLYGIRPEGQARLLAQGHRVRIRLPFGKQWFPYVMQRLGEHPANLAAVIHA